MFIFDLLIRRRPSPPAVIEQIFLCGGVVECVLVLASQDMPWSKYWN